MKSIQDEVAEFSKPNANWIEIVKNIRLESFKAGLTKAADIASHRADINAICKNNGFAEAFRGLETLILSSRDNTKEI